MLPPELEILKKNPEIIHFKRGICSTRPTKKIYIYHAPYEGVATVIYVKDCLLWFKSVNADIVASRLDKGA